MAKFVPREKMSRKARKELDRKQRVTWDFSPSTKIVASKKVYSRKKNAYDRDEYGISVFDFPLFGIPSGSCRTA